MTDIDLDDLGSEDNVGLEAEDRKHLKNNKLDWFKGQMGVTYRISLLYFYPLEMAVAMAVKRQAEKQGKTATKEQMLEAAQKVLTKRAEELGKSVDALEPHEKLSLDNIRFKKVRAHYQKDGVGYVVSRLGKDGPEADEVWKTLGDVKNYFCTIILIYPTNREGELVKESLATHWQVKPWRAHSKIYESLIDEAESLKANDLTIANQDLTAKCTNEDFQNFTIKSAGKALWRKDSRFQAKVLEKALEFYDKLSPFRELSTADLRIKLGMSNGSSESDSSGDDFENLLEGV